MTAPSYRENHAGIAAMRSTPAMRKALEEMGGKVEAEAERLSPVVTGHYRASWYVASVSDSDGVRIRVGNSAPYARFLEYGTRYMARQRILGRALDAVNLA